MTKNKHWWFGHSKHKNGFVFSFAMLFFRNNGFNLAIGYGLGSIYINYRKHHDPTNR